MNFLRFIFSGRKAEAIAWIFFLALNIYLLRDLLITANYTLPHDHYYWNLSPFSLFARHAVNLSYALWNPFSHGGEPFYPQLVFLQVLEPLPWLITLVFRTLRIDDPTLLFNYVRIVQIWVMVFGIYLVVRKWTRIPWIRVSTIPILLLSSIFLAGLRQWGIVVQFMWVPYLYLALNRIAFVGGEQNLPLRFWLICGLLVGLHWQAYYFVGLWVALALYLISLAIFNKDRLHRLWNVISGNFTKVLMGSAVALGMILPNVITLLDSHKFIYPARIHDSEYASMHRGPYPEEGNLGLLKAKNLKMSYEVLASTGSSFSPWNILQAFSPLGNAYVEATALSWGAPSEGFIFLGFATFVIALLGFCCGRHPQKKFWMFQLILFIWIMLGPAAGLHQFLHTLFPPLQFLRHTYTLVSFVVFILIFFFILGLKTLISNEKRSLRLSMPLMAYVAVQSILLFFWPIIHDYCLVKKISYLQIIFIAVMILFNIRARKFLSGYELFIGILCSFFLCIFFGIAISGNANSAQILAANLIYILTNSAFLLALLLFVKQARKPFTGSFQRYFAAAIFVTILTADLVFGIFRSSHLYRRFENPVRAIGGGISLFGPLPLPHTRALGSHGPWRHEQAMRSPEILLTQGGIFSPIRRYPQTLMRDIIPDWNWQQWDKQLTIMNLYYPRESGLPFAPLLSSVKDNTIDLQLDSRRWNSVLTLKSYYSLVHGGFRSDSLANFFALDMPIFQFKEGYLQAENSESGLLQAIDRQVQRKELLERYAIVSDHTSVPSYIPVLSVNAAISSLQGAKATNAFFWKALPQKSYSELEVHVNSERAGILYWADGYDSDWRAWIGGNEVPLRRANLNFKAIEIPAGFSKIQFKYKPLKMIWALNIYYSIFALTILLIGLDSLIKIRRE